MSLIVDAEIVTVEKGSKNKPVIAVKKSSLM